MAWPTTDDPRVNFVTLRLTDAEVDDLDAYALIRNMSRSAAVRECVAQVVGEDGLG